jgi:hypothetical protein
LDDGSKVVSTLGAGTPYTVIEPRHHLVYISTHHDRFVNVDADGSIHNRRTRAEVNYATRLDPQPETLDGARVALQASAAFWLIDWNGGQLLDGDRISLQVFKDDAQHFVSTFGRAGSTRWRNGAGADETFEFRRVGGTRGAPINHRDSVTLRSATGNYLLAAPPDYLDAQILNTATVPREWETFQMHFVHSYDSDRTSYF